jgi:hypothetical protein
MPSLSTKEYKTVSEIFNRLMFWEEQIRKGYESGTMEDRSRYYSQHVVILDLKGFITRKLEEEWMLNKRVTVLNWP